MSTLARLKILYRLLGGNVRGSTHAERVEDFYSAQADGYDDTRVKMLHGREDLIREISFPDSAVWVDFGCGTGSNLELLRGRIEQVKEAHLVDLSESLLKVANRRIEKFAWKNVHLHLEDATTFAPTPAADVVLFSYSLTMIPEWYAAIDNAKRILKPNGVIAVVDYYISRNHLSVGKVRHSRLYRTYAPTLFAKNNVHPSPDHIDYLHYHFDPVHFSEHMGKAYGRWLDIHYYRFIGRTKGTVSANA